MAQSTPSSYLYGLALRLMLNASVGVSPWDVLHTGLTHHLPVTIGQMTVGVAMLIVVIIDSGLGWRRTVAVSKVLGKPNVTNTLPRGV